MAIIIATSYHFSVSAGTLTGTIEFEESTPKAAVVYTKSKDFKVLDIEIDQENALFNEFIYVAQPGSKVHFKNTDRFRHNIFLSSLPIDLKYNAGILKRNDKRSKTIDWAADSFSKVSCYLHTTMESYLAVIESNNYELIDFRAANPYHKKSRGYRSRTAQPITNLQDRQVFTLGNISPGEKVYVLIPHMPPLTIIAQESSEKTIPIRKLETKIGTLTYSYKN
ncbi:hypothetical protein [Pleionea sediminis]|uniref:hypothetical protein n=1 Tax=Pleionea sediminis TaxID=2569479 RepID=UPI0011851751|nr:hypothetical protein [Pleionea sediminis]